MKKINLLLSVLFVLAVLAGCGPKSVKGKWTDTDKTTFKTEFEKSLKASQTGMADDVITKISDCTIAKLEAEFSPEELDKPEAATKVGEITTACLTESMPAPAMETPAATETDTTKTETPAKQ